MQNPAHDIQTRQIEGFVAATRRRLISLTLAAGLAWVVAAVVGYVTVAACLDMLAPMSVPLRVIAFSLIWIVLSTVAILWLVFPAVRPPTVQKVASLIERAIPGMHNRLLTVLDLRSREAAPTGNVTTDAARAMPDEAFVDRLLRQTRDRLDGFRSKMVAPATPAVRASMVATIAVLAICVLFYGLDERMPTALARVLRPTAEIAPVAWVKLRAEPGNTEVLQGEPATIRVRFERGDTDDVKIAVRPEGPDGKWFTYTMEREPGQLPVHTISEVNTSYDYQIIAGGTWTPIHRVTMLRRPLVEQVGYSVHLPDYLKMSEPRPVNDNAGQISALTGSTIEVAANVSGEPVSGVVKLVKNITKPAQVTRENEIVWFEDDIPSDAESIGQWRWMSEQVFSGAKAHTFNWSRQPYGMKTRLNKLAAPAGSSLFTYAYLDPRDTPTKVTLTFTVNNVEMQATWATPTPANKNVPAAGQPAVATGAKISDQEWAEVLAPDVGQQAVPVGGAPKARSVSAGRLPEAGKWARLEIPVATLVGSNPGVAQISGIVFAANKGRVFFDRAGAVEKKTETVQQVTQEPAGEIAMTQDSQNKGRWIGNVPVQADGVLTLEFANARGHKSPAMKAMPFVATTDHPPAVLVEKPGRNLTIPEPDAVPIMIRGFHDYAVADIGIQVGNTADKLGDTKWIATFDQAQQSRLVVTAIDPKELKLAPGASVFYKGVVRDRKGQTTASETFRLGLAAPGQANAAGVDKGLAQLNPLMEGINSLLKLQGKIGDETLSLLKNLPPGLLPGKWDGTLLELKNPDGTPMTAEQIAKMLKEKWDKLTPEQKKSVEELAKDLEKLQAEQFAMSQKLNEAAGKAQESALAMPAEASLLKEMAEQMRAMAAETPVDEATLERLKALNELTPEQKEELEQLKAELQKLQEARAMVAKSPDAAQAEMAAMLQQMQANRANNAMGDLQQAMEQQREELEALRGQVAALQKQAKGAPARDMDEVSKLQQKLDAEAMKELAEARDLMREQLAALMKEQEEMPPEPWMAPGEKREGVPDEADTPEDKKKEEEKNKDKAAAADKKKEEEKNWWDKPIDQPQLGMTLEENERLANKDQRPVKPENQTPRDMLDAHQNEMQNALKHNEDRLAKAEENARNMSSQMSDLMKKMSSGSPEERAAAMQQMRQMMNSSQMRSAMAAAARAQASQAQAKAAMAQALAQAKAASAQGSKPGEGKSQSQSQSQAQKPGSGQSQNPGSKAPPPNPSSFSKGGVRNGLEPIPGSDLTGVEITGDGAALYRLPPRLREPLIQGMQERGPEGYQRLIDAYYRQLSKDAQ